MKTISFNRLKNKAISLAGMAAIAVATVPVTAEAARNRVESQCVPLVVTDINVINSELNRPGMFRLFFTGKVQVMSDKPYLAGYKGRQISVFHLTATDASGKKHKLGKYKMKEPINAWGHQLVRRYQPLNLPEGTGHSRNTLKVEAQVYNYECTNVLGGHPRAAIYPRSAFNFNLNAAPRGAKVKRVGRPYIQYVRPRPRGDRGSNNGLAGVRN